VATDTAGNIYVGAVTSVNGQESNPRMMVFSPGSSGAAKPLSTLQLAGTPDAIAVDGTGNIYASSRQSNTTYEYPVGATGNAAPTRGLAQSCDQLVIDLNGNLLCASDGGGRVSVFGPTQSGNVAPVRVINPGAAYVLNFDDRPTLVGLTVDAAGNIFIGVAPVGGLPVDTVFKAAGGTTSNDQGSPVASVTAALKGIS
jgi:sugar lactone lactonase YvrE